VIPSRPSRWIAAAVPEEAVTRLAAEHPRRLSQLLALRGIRSAPEAASFLRPEGLLLEPPISSIPGLAEAVARLGGAAERGDLVFLVGDYDVDGVSSVALLASVLTSCGARVELHLPRRDGEGYGLQPEHVNRAVARGAHLLVAVDSGTSAHAAALAARRARLPLVVVDHHLPDGDLPVDAIVVNPNLHPESNGLRVLTAAGLSLLVATAMLRRAGREIPWEALLRVACLGTIADVAPLVGVNRALVTRGLEALRSPRSPGLRALLEVSGLRGPIRSADVAFRLAPRLNAAGRLGSADLALELLLCREPQRAREVAARLDHLNGERQRIEERMIEEVRTRLAARKRLPRIVVEWRPGWHPGVIGVAAARIARELHRPAILLALADDVAVGSGRSVDGVSLHSFLHPWSPRLVRFGGHSQAIGLTVVRQSLESLREEWESAAETWPAELSRRERRYDLRLDLEDFDESLLSAVEALEPFGRGNEEPIFRIGPCRPAGSPREFGRGHLAFDLTTAPGAAVRSVVDWRGGARADDLRAGEPIELLVALERDRLRGLRLRQIERRRMTEGRSD
jgi:single-stranded-DNA-specific exonuclease